jgi:hypothetical protein
VGIHIHGPQDNDRRYGIHIQQLNWDTRFNEMVPRVADLISAMEYFHLNNCGLIEVIDSVVVGDEPSIQNGATEFIVGENGIVTLAIAEGDNADFLRGVLIAARSAGTIHNHWVVSVLGGVTLTFQDPALMPAPRDLPFSQDQIDYPQRLTH